MSWTCLVLPHRRAIAAMAWASFSFERLAEAPSHQRLTPRPAAGVSAAAREELLSGDAPALFFPLFSTAPVFLAVLSQALYVGTQDFRARGPAQCIAPAPVQIVRDGRRDAAGHARAKGFNIDLELGTGRNALRGDERRHSLGLTVRNTVV